MRDRERERETILGQRRKGSTTKKRQPTDLEPFGETFAACHVTALADFKRGFGHAPADAALVVLGFLGVEQIEVVGRGGALGSAFRKDQRLGSGGSVDHLVLVRHSLQEAHDVLVSKREAFGLFAFSLDGDVYIRHKKCSFVDPK